MEKITCDDIKKMLDEIDDLSVLASVDKFDLSYYKIKETDFQKEILAALKRIQYDTQKVDNPERADVWENGWGENLRDFEDSLDIDDLIPKYFRPDIPFRLQGHLVKSNNTRFEYELGNIIKQCLYEMYAADVEDIYDFGCGTGYNLIQIGKMFPEKMRITALNPWMPWVIQAISP